MSGSRLHHDPGIQTPVAWLTGTQGRGQTVQIEVRAAAASLGVIAFSYSGLTSPLEPWGVLDVELGRLASLVSVAMEGGRGPARSG
jgi:hypothetical protein